MQHPNRSPSRSCPWSALALSLALVALAVPGSAQDYRILVTNDDGIDATALKETVKALAGLGDIVVVAPAEDRSYYGFARTTPSGVLLVAPARIKGASVAYAVDGTPVDAVLWAIEVLGRDRPFDAVIAGVNRGSSLGSDALSTGTVGAAMTAASLGLPAVAVAQDKTAHVYDVAAGVAAEIVRKWLTSGLASGVAVSVNVPAVATRRPDRIHVAPLGESEWEALGFEKIVRDDPQEMWRVQFKKNRRPTHDTDLDAYQRGEITVTALRADVTAGELLEALAAWELTAPAPATAPSP